MSFITQEANGLLYHTSTILKNPAITHGFSTRTGGVSTDFRASLNFRGSGPDPDDPVLVRENYRRFCAVLDADPQGLVLSRQVHQDTVRPVTRSDAGLDNPRDYTADALITNEPGLSLMVFSADCTILLLHDPVARCIGAVHAGWRGAALDLPAKALAEMVRLYGAKPSNVRVAIGAGIGECCFETHDDVPDAMRQAFGSEVEQFMVPAGEKWHVDLKSINAWRLWKAGVSAAHLDICPLCTCCNTGLYWSHRKTGDRRGVQGALIGLKQGGAS